MKRKYIIDLIFISFSVLLAFLLVERPGAVDAEKPSTVGGKKDAAKLGTPGIEAMPEVKWRNGLKERNIFAPNAVEASFAGMPQASYTLTGIVYGNAKKAFFREDTGKVVSIGEGERLGDGSVVRHIDKLSVRVKRGKEEMEYRIFKVEEK